MVMIFIEMLQGLSVEKQDFCALLENYTMKLSKAEIFTTSFSAQTKTLDFAASASRSQRIHPGGGICINVFCTIHNM